jgi:chorismate mutase
MRHFVLLATVGTLLLTGPPAMAVADQPSPLFALVDAAAQRLATADPVAAFKWIDGGSIEDAARVRQVLDSVGADAAAQRVDEAFVRRVFSDQIHATEGVEYMRFGQWKLDPAAAPTTAPDLAASRAAIDGFNHTMVTEIALQWDSLRGPDCDVALDGARSSVSAARQLDPLYEQALDFATHSYCD